MSKHVLPVVSFNESSELHKEDWNRDEGKNPERKAKSSFKS